MDAISGWCAGLMHADLVCGRRVKCETTLTDQCRLKSTATRRWEDAFSRALKPASAAGSLSAKASAHRPTTRWISLCSASYVGCQRDTTRICCWAPCCGAAAAVDRYRAARKTLNSKRAARRSCGGIMEKTDRRTDVRPFRRPCSAYYASSVNKRRSLLRFREKSVAMSESGCLSVCLSASKPQECPVHVACDRGSVIFWRRCNMSCTSCLWMTPWLGTIGQAWATRVVHLLKVTHQGQHEFDTAAYTQTDSWGGSRGPRRSLMSLPCSSDHNTAGVRFWSSLVCLSFSLFANRKSG